MTLSYWLVEPWMMIVLLTIGICGLGIQLFSVKYWWPSLLGIASFMLYFYGNYHFGQPTFRPLVFFAFGLLLLFTEIFIPSFGVLGTLGFIGLVSSVVWAAHDRQQAVIALIFAFVLSVVIVSVIVRRFKLEGVWSRFILTDQQKNERGYTSASSKEYLLNRTGISRTHLRPSGVAIIDDERVNVVTQGEYISPDRKIKVVQVEGMRVIVREIAEDKQLAPEK